MEYREYLFSYSRGAQINSVCNYKYSAFRIKKRKRKGGLAKACVDAWVGKGIVKFGTQSNQSQSHVLRLLLCAVM